MNKYQVLVVEDDIMISNLMSATLEMTGYAYRTATNGKEAIMSVLSYKPDIMLLDLGLPDMSGIEIIRKVREWSSMPIIVVSARTDIEDKVEALDAGADDYLTKPFSVDELLARIRVALRRAGNITGERTAEDSVYSNGTLRIDYAAGCVFVEEEEVHLTPMEYKILCLLARNTGKVLSYNYILKEIWGGVNESDMASLRVYVTLLRRKIESTEEHLIQTHVGIGYRMLSHQE